MKFNKLHWQFFISLILLIGIAFVLSGCEPKEKGQPFPNRPPVARLANVPVNDTASVPEAARGGGLKAVVSLYWVGNDPDGFVTAFAYRWSYKDSINSNIIHYRPWSILLNYVTYRRSPLSSNSSGGFILMLDIRDTSDARKVAPSIYRFFANADLDGDKFNPLSKVFDSSLYNIFSDLDIGRARMINGVRVYASNPYNNRYPIHESPNKGTFIFESDDILNRHKFEIFAIDNEGTVSAQPDTVAFWTRQVEPPTVEIPRDALQPGVTDSLFVLKNTTYTWGGIRFNFVGRDRNSRQIWYSYRVDSVRWSPWSGNRFAAITASDMDPTRPYTGRHTFEVRAKNEFGKVSLPDTATPRRDMRSFLTVYPTFAEPGTPKKVLLVNHTRDNPGTVPYYPSNAQINRYYQDIYDSLGLEYDVWTTKTLGLPSYSTMGRYSTIHIINDQGPYGPDVGRMLIAGAAYGRYLDVGGYIIMNALPVFIPAQMIELPESLLVKRMHLLGDYRQISLGRLTDCVYMTNRANDFIGAFGNTALGFPSYVELDSSKLNPRTGNDYYIGGLPVTAVSYPRGFGEIIFSFDSKSDTVIRGACQPFIFQGHSMGYLYRGINFKTAYYGFPLWFVKKHQAQAIIKRTYQLFYPDDYLP